MRLPLRAPSAGIPGCALFSRNRFNLLSFHDADHGDDKTPLVEWIDALLKEEGVRDADGEIWLQAMPGVLGFVFNPVSFWFCYRADEAADAMVDGIERGQFHIHFPKRFTNSMRLARLLPYQVYFWVIHKVTGL